MEKEDANEEGSESELPIVCCRSQYEPVLVIIPGRIVPRWRLDVSGGVKLMGLMRLGGAVGRRIARFFFFQAQKRDRDREKDRDRWIGYGEMERGGS